LRVRQTSSTALALARFLVGHAAVTVRATGMGDTRTLVIPVAPSIFWEAGPQARAEMNIADGLVRVSVGVEDEADLIADFAQAMSPQE
jgi:O-acetylhomoserine (thiol)-lyase